MTIALAAVVAALLAAVGPRVLAVLPEPQDPDEGKILYSTLATRSGLTWKLALSAAVFGALAAWWIPEPRLLPVWILLGAVGGLLAFIDWNTHLLPFWIVAPTWVWAWVAIAVSAVWMRDTDVLVQALVGNLVVFGVFWLLHVIANLFFGGAFGYGDVRLSAVLGVALGPLGVTATFIGVYAGFALGAVIGLIRQRGRLRGGPALAFGPFMVMGALCGLLVK